MRTSNEHRPPATRRGSALVLVVGLGIAGAAVGVLINRWNAVSIPAPRAADGGDAALQQRTAQVEAGDDRPFEQVPVRERATSQILDKFEAQHAEAVSRVLGEQRTAVVECLVLEQRLDTGMLRLLCRETDEAKGTRIGDVIETYHDPVSELRRLHIDTGYESVRPGEVRSFLLQRVWWKTALRIPGKVTGTVDFPAMRNACDWPTGRDWIGKAEASVVEGRLATTAPSKRAQRRGLEEALLTIERVHWSPVGWEPAEVQRVLLVPAALAPEEAGEPSFAQDPPHGVTLLLVVGHGWLVDGMLLQARVR